MKEKSKLKVLIVDDQSFSRENLIMILSTFDRLEIVGEAENGLQAIDKVKELSPDLVFMDIQMPALDGIGATRKIKQIKPDTIVIAYSSEIEDHIINTIKNAGASDYLFKTATLEEIEFALKDFF